MIGQRGKEIEIVEIETKMELDVAEIKFGKIEIERIQGDTKAVTTFSAVVDIDLVTTQFIGNAPAVEDAVVDVVVGNEIGVFAEAGSDINNRV